MKFSIFLFSSFIICSTAVAQTPSADTSAIKQTINNLFTGMLNADTVLIRSCFASDAVLQTVSVKQSGTKVMGNEISDFTRQVFSSGKGMLDERISFAAVHVDGHLASVWTPYKFYYKGNFLHCGVNSFQLVKLGGEWKIQYLIDTRRKDGCEE